MGQHYFMMLIGASALAWGEVSADPSLRDKDILQRRGPWVVLSIDGLRAGAHVVGKDQQYIFSDREVRVVADDGELISRGTYVLDPRPSPKTLDLPGDGKTGHAIYMLDEDMLTICFTEDGKARPKSFIGNAATGQMVYKLQPKAERVWTILHREPSGVHAVTFSKDGRLLAWGTGSMKAAGTVKLWDVLRGRLLGVLQGHRQAVSAIDFSPDSKMLVTGSPDRTVRLWDVAQRREKACWTGHSEMVNTVSYSLNGQLVASGSDDATVRLWSPVSLQHVATLRGDSGIVSSLAFQANGKTLVSVSHDEHTVWDLATLKPRRVRKRSGLRGDPMAFSPDGSELAIAPGNGPERVSILDASTGRERAALHHDDDRFLTLVFSPDGRTLASWGKARVRLWELSTKRERAILGTYRRYLYVSSMAFSPDGSKLATTETTDEGIAVRLWDLSKLRGKNWTAPALPVELQGDGKGTLRGKAPSIALTSAQLEEIWRELGSEDAYAAYRAVLALVQSPEQSVPFLKEHLHRLGPLSVQEQQQIAMLIRELDVPAFAARDKAMKELENYGELAKPALKEVLSKKPSAEVQHRAERLLDHAEKTLRPLRAIEVLESIGTTEAQNVLRALAQGEEGARVTREARASLSRLAKRVGLAG
jgi:uncharacterized protein (TIGR03067 family)